MPAELGWFYEQSSDTRKVVGSNPTAGTMEKILTSEQIRESWDLASQADIVFKIRKARFFKIKRFLSKFLI